MAQISGKKIQLADSGEKIYFENIGYRDNDSKSRLTLHKDAIKIPVLSRFLYLNQLLKLVHDQLYSCDVDRPNLLRRQSQ